MFTRRVLVTTVATVLLAGLPVVSARAPQTREQAPPADLVLTNGRILTVDDATPEAQAIAVTGDRITALGSSADMKRYVGANTKVIDVKGQLVMPGFTEGHGHFTSVGESQLQLNLMKVQTWDEIVAMVEQAAPLPCCCFTEFPRNRGTGKRCGRGWRRAIASMPST